MARNVEVDVSFAALEYLEEIGYSRVRWVLSENHPKPDVCDQAYSKFGQKFVSLTSLLDKAPIYKNHPPATIYGMTHPQCRCSYMVYPPKTPRGLRLPGSSSMKQREVILQHMYPQQVWAGSKKPATVNIDFSSFVDVIPARKPVRDDQLYEEETWYREAWDYVKKYIFRQANSYTDFIRYAHTKTAFQSLRFGDLFRVIDDVDFVSEFHISTPVFSGYTGMVLGDYTEDELFVYVAPYNSVMYLPKNKLVKVSNRDVEDPCVGKRIRLYNNQLNDNVEALVIRKMDDDIWVYDPVSGKTEHLSEQDLNFYD